uniref:serine/arginine repetitive matrix protein 1-like isoform X2 n=1 Tax=Styela clava TaxID=7725 RepID=UPI00193A06B4|nr:serine/arginine repetitive matrix protein 1-like isoform X2 [Styela clava]
MAHMMPPGPNMVPEHLPNPDLVKKVVQQLKINGLFDEMRRDCLADIDTKPAFQNLKQRVEGHVTGILDGQRWSPTLNKNQLRSKIRESVMQSGILNEGVERILFQVFNAKVHSLFLPKIEEFIKENGDELRKEFLPPPMEIPMMGNAQFVPPPAPVPPEMHPENLPPMPAQPPPPESPSIGIVNETAKMTPETVTDVTMETTVEEIQNLPEQEISMKDIAPEDVIVKAINTPSPQHSPELNEDEAPKIPEDAVNPLRSLIQSLLVSKKSIIETNDDESTQVPDEQSMDIGEETIKVEGYSPTIDPSEIEGFTDDEADDDNSQKQTQNENLGPQTPRKVEPYSPKMRHVSKSPDPSEQYSPTSPPCSEPYSPTSPYSPLSPNRQFTEVVSPASNSSSHKKIPKAYADPRSDTDSRNLDEGDTPAYDPTKFSYQRMSDSTQYIEDLNAQSPPSPISGDVTDVTDRGRYTDDNLHLFSEESKHDTDMRKTDDSFYQKPVKDRRRKHKSTSSSSGSGSSGSLSSSSSEDENDETVVEQVIVQEVEEMVEEIEVVEEYTSDSGTEKQDIEIEEGEEIKSDGSAEVKDKKKKKKNKKRKTKKARKRHRSSSISSGEITSSGELSSDSSSNERRPTRPTGPPKQKPLDLHELEERRRVHIDDSSRDRPFWQNTESSSDYLSSPGRMRRPYSPTRRPFSPDFHRFKEERYRPSGPHFRDRPMYPADFRSIRHPRFSPPPSFRRSPPLRYSPGPRMEYPGPMPFGSPRSPPRRPYSPPPHMMGGFPGDRAPFPHPKPRWGSPPHLSHRRSSRSPPPGLRRDDGPGPSRF